MALKLKQIILITICGSKIKLKYSQCLYEAQKLEFLLKKRNEYTDLVQITCKILITPASVVPVNRLFLSGEGVTRIKRNPINR